MANFSGIGKLPEELDEQTELSEDDLALVGGSDTRRTTWKNIFGKISFTNLLTTAKNFIDAVNELKEMQEKHTGYLQDYVVTESVSLPTITIEANTTCATQSYELGQKEGYKPIGVMMENAWAVTCFFMYLKLVDYTVKYRIRNVGSDEHESTPSVAVIWIRDLGSEE